MFPAACAAATKAQWEDVERNLSARRASCNSCKQCPRPQKGVTIDLDYLPVGKPWLARLMFVCLFLFPSCNFPAPRPASTKVYCWTRYDFRHYEMIKQEKKRAFMFLVILGGQSKLEWANGFVRTDWSSSSISCVQNRTNFQPLGESSVKAGSASKAETTASSVRVGEGRERLEDEKKVSSYCVLCPLLPIPYNERLGLSQSTLHGEDFCCSFTHEETRIQKGRVLVGT